MTVNTTDITSGPYTGNGVTTQFAYTFRIEDKTQIRVFETTDLGVETELTVDTDYTVAGIGVDVGGTITRVAGALPLNYIWFIRSDYEETQVTAFASQGGFFPDVHEAAMDKMTFLIQQLRETSNRSASISESYTGAGLATLPDPVSGLYLRWKTNLQGFENAGQPSLVVPTEEFGIVSDMSSSTTLIIGDIVNTIGYQSKGDGGDNQYEIVAAATGTDDGGSFIDLPGSGLQAQGLFPGGVISVKQFNATGDGVVDDSTAGQATMDASRGEVYLPEGDYLWEGVTVPANTRVYGPGVIKSKIGISSPDADDFSKNSILASGVSNIVFDGITFDGGIVGEIGGSEFAADDPDNLESPLDIQNCTNVTITGCTFTNISTQATALGTRNQKAKKGVVYILGCTNVLIEKCTLSPNNFIEGLVILDSIDIVIDRNYARLIDDNKRISSPIVVTGAATQNVIVTNNILEGHGGSAMNLWGTDSFIVQNNIIKGPGIDFSNEGGYTVTASPTNINICNNTIDMNGWHVYVSTSNGYGVFVAGTSSFSVNDVKITGNTCIRTGRGIFCDWNDDVLIEGNRVINCHGSGAARGLSIATTDCTRVQVLGNSINGEPTGFGQHDGSGDASILTDTTQAWTVNELVNLTVVNVTDGSSATITANTATTVTGVLSGGTDNDWDVSDSYTVGAGVCCIYTEDSDDVLIKNNILNEAGTYLLYINVDNGRVRVEGNTFKYSTTSPTRNIFGAVAASTNLIVKNNTFPILASSIDYNTTFSSEDYVSFEDTQIIEIADDAVYTFSVPVSYYFVEISTSANGNAGCFAHNDAALQEIYAGSSANVTTGVLSGTTGTDGMLNLSAVGDTLYVENRLGSTEFFRIKIRG